MGKYKQYENYVGIIKVLQSVTHFYVDGFDSNSKRTYGRRWYVQKDVYVNSFELLKAGSLPGGL